MRPRDAEKSRDHSRHGCFVEADKRLAEDNTRLGYAFTIQGSETRLMIATEKLNVQQRTRPKKMLATFCPFCGGRL